MDRRALRLLAACVILVSGETSCASSDTASGVSMLATRATVNRRTTTTEDEDGSTAGSEHQAELIGQAEPSCPPGGGGVRLTRTRASPLLQRVLRAAGDRPRILVLSCGDRKQGALTGRLTERWAKGTGNEVEFANFAKYDKKPYSNVDPKTFIKNFLSRSRRTGSVIMYSGHGRRREGGWLCQPKPKARMVLITPVWMKDVAEEVGGAAPVIVTGSCYGGHWLTYFNGLSGAPPNYKNSPAFYSWMFKGGRFPREENKYPMCKAL